MPDISIEAIVVNDGSDNDAFKKEKPLLQSNPSIKLLEYNPNKGKGEAVRTGVRAATGTYIIYTDIDFPYTIESINKVIELLKSENADVVIGTKDSSYYDHVPVIRRFISRLLRMLIRLFFRMPTDDTQCGLKGFNQRGKSVFLQTTIARYLFDLEFVFLASHQPALQVKTQEVILCDNVQFRKMNFGILPSELLNLFKIALS